MQRLHRAAGKVQKYSFSGDDLIADDEGAENIIPMATDGIYLYGRHVGASAVPWRTSDLLTWVKVGGVQAISYMYAMKDGTRLLGINGSTAYYSIDQGATWVEATTQPDWTAAGLVWPLADSGWSEDDSGVVMFGEYKATAGGHRIHKSTDGGVNWSTTLDVAGESPEPKHCHCTCWHAATDTWFAVFGDSEQRQWWKSTDSGDSWALWGAGGADRGRQPVNLRDFGDAKYLFLGADEGCSAAGLVDATAAAFETAEIIEFRCYWTDGIGLQQNSWAIEYHNGIAYLFQRATAAAATQMRELSVSQNLTDWTTVAITTIATGFEHSAGVFLGKVHLNRSHADHYVLDITGVVDDTAVLLSPGHTNLYAEAASDASNKALWFAASGQALTDDAATPYVGASAVKARRADEAVTNTTVYGCYYSVVALTLNTLYSASMRLRGYNTDDSCEFFQLRFGRSTGAEGLTGSVRLSGTDWGKAQVQHTPGVSANFWLTANALRTTNGANDILHDALQINEGDQQPWQIGGTALAATVASASVSGDVSHEIVLQPFTASYRQSSTPLKYIFSYVKDASNYLRIYYDPADKVFGFQRTVGGADQSAVESAAVEFGDQSEIRLTVSMTASATTMVVKVNEESETISEENGLDGIVTWKYGDQDGANGWTFWLSQTAGEQKADLALVDVS